MSELENAKECIRLAAKAGDFSHLKNVVIEQKTNFPDLRIEYLWDLSYEAAIDTGDLELVNKLDKLNQTALI